MEEYKINLPKLINTFNVDINLLSHTRRCGDIDQNMNLLVM